MRKSPNPPKTRFHSEDVSPQGNMAERELWSEVLLRATYDVAGLIEEKNNAWRIKVSAREWFAANDESVGSLFWICQQLGLDAKAIRHAMIGPHGNIRRYKTKVHKPARITGV